MNTIRHPQLHLLDLPLRAHGGHRHWLLIIGLILLAIFLIGVTVTGGTG